MRKQAAVSIQWDGHTDWGWKNGSAAPSKRGEAAKQTGGVSYPKKHTPADCASLTLKEGGKGADERRFDPSGALRHLALRSGGLGEESKVRGGRADDH